MRNELVFIFVVFSKSRRWNAGDPVLSSSRGCSSSSSGWEIRHLFKDCCGKDECVFEMSGNISVVLNHSTYTVRHACHNTEMASHKNNCCVSGKHTVLTYSICRYDIKMTRSFSYGTRITVTIQYG